MNNSNSPLIQEEQVACFKRSDFPKFHTGKLDDLIFPMGRSEAHKTNTPHIICRIYAVDPNGRFLIQRRSPSRKSHPDMYTDSASGHIQYSTNINYKYIEQEAFRELEEEMGTKVIFGKLVDINLEEFRSGGCELSYNFYALVEPKCKPDPIETAPESGFYSERELYHLLESKEFVPITKKYWRLFIDNREYNKLLQKANQKELSEKTSDDGLQYQYFYFQDGTGEQHKLFRIGVLIGRFQPFHKGHLLLVLKALETVELLKIGIGSMQYDHTIENPFTFQERKEMIQRALKEANVDSSRYQVYGIPDLHDMSRWTKSIEDIVGDYDLFYSNNEWTRQLVENLGKQVSPFYRFEFDRYNGTKIREKIRKGEDLSDVVSPAVVYYLEEINAKERIK